MIAKYGLPELVMSYNPYDHNSITSMHIKNVFQIPWICIVADMPTKQSDRAKQIEYLSNSDGNIYLSWEMYENSTSNNKFHLDGGIVNDQLTRLETDKSKKHKKSILYAGSLTRWGGINKLLEAYALINDDFNLKLSTMLEDIKSGKFNKELSQYIDDGKSPKSFKNLEDLKILCDLLELMPALNHFRFILFSMVPRWRRAPKIASTSE